MILDQSQISMNVGRITVGDKQGTVFLVSDNIAVTADHVIEDECKGILLEFLNIEEEPVGITATRIKLSESEGDIAFLKLTEPISGFEHLTFSNGVLPSKANWTTFGYPEVESMHGMFMSGVVEQIKTKYNPSDYNMIIRYNGQEFNTEGASGSPIIVDGHVVGVITDDKGAANLLGVFACNIFEKELVELNLIKKIVKQEIDSSVGMENETVSLISKTINELDRGFIFVKGKPGSGKSFIAKQLEDKDFDAVIIGKYFVEDDSDDLGVGYKASATIFGKWIVNSISKELYYKYIEEKDYSTENLIELASKYMGNLTKTAKKENKKYIFFLDGIDAVARVQRQGEVDLFKVLPKSISENIIFVIFGNDESILPVEILRTLNDKNLILMQPILDEQIIQYFKDNLNLDNPEYADIVALAKLSEGNPLYIYYINEYINSIKNVDLHAIIGEFPAFDGQIENYYESIWNVIKDEDLSVKLSAIIARVRYSIDMDLLFNTFVVDERISFNNVYSKLSYLLNESRGVRFYHGSFSIFIQEKTNFISQDINRLIAYACNDKKSRYSIENQIYHLCRGREEEILKAIQLCNQDWIDNMALNHVEPDRILVDIKDVLYHVVERKKISEIVRIHLLIQRLKFRNENMFREYAYEMANALFYNKFYEEALSYLIREDILTIESNETLHMMRLYMLEDNEENALTLDKVLQRKCVKEYETGEVSNLTIMSDLASTALMRMPDFGHRLQMFGNLLKQSEYDDAEELMSQFVADTVGYTMWNEDQYASVLDIDNEQYILNEDTVDLVLNIVNSYLNHEHNFYRKHSTSFQKAISDLEELCNKYEVSKKKEVALILLKYGSDNRLLNKLNYGFEEVFELRDSNGVDINAKGIRIFYDNCLLNSFVSFDLDSIIIDDVDWEEKLENIVRYVASIEALCWKAKKTNENELRNEAIMTLLHLINFFKFDLGIRAEWERSYFLPEHIMPFIWGKITNLIQMFGRNHLDKYVDQLLNGNQLGLYNEGYRRSLFEVLLEFNRESDLKIYSLKVLLKLEEITDEFVENRWERTRDFLRIITGYGKIGAHEKAAALFSKMLETSMGPSWYKEAQMSLMGHAIKGLPFVESGKEYLIESLANLDYASGEMTFQRYIRDEKEAFIGIIYERFGLNYAIEYYKSLVLPEPAVILKNSNKKSFDKVEEGGGYVQGTMEVDLQDGILSLIDCLENVSPDILWALSEIFIQGDDRYFYRFSQLQAELLNAAKVNDLDLYKELNKRVERQYIAEFDNTRRNYYLKELQIANIDRELIERLNNLTSLENVQFTSYSRYQDDEIEFSDDSSELMKEFNLQIQLGNKKAAKDLMANELIKVHDKGISISNYSYITNLALELINRYSESSEEVIELLDHIIKNPFGHMEWILIDTLIDVIGNKLNEEESTEVLEIIMEHFQLLLRTPSDVLGKYEWLLRSYEEDKNNDLTIFEFMLWLSNLPDMINIRDRAFDVVLWLVCYNSEKYIAVLLDKIVDESDYTVKEYCCAVLHNIAQTDLILPMCNKIKTHKSFVEYLNNTNDFLVLSTLYEILKKCKNEAGELCELVEHKIFHVGNDDKRRFKTSSVKVEFADDSFTFNALNELVCFEAEDLEIITNLVKNSCPVSIKAMKKVESMIERSYHIHKGSSKYCERILLRAINNVIIKYVSLTNYQKVVELLRRYNPNSPELIVGERRPCIFENVISALDGESSNFDDCIFYDDSYILHFHEAVENEEENRFDSVEICAFLCDEFNIEKADKYRKYNLFFVNTDPSLVKFDDGEGGTEGTPLINKAELAHVYGSMYTASEVYMGNDKAMMLETNSKRLSWRNGKCLNVTRFGMPKKEGTFLTVEKQALDEFRKGFSLIFEVHYNMQVYYLDYDKKIVY